MRSELTIINVVAGILWREGHYLAAQRPPGSAHAGFWEFPGGKIEPGESREEALQRELREELGVETQEVRFWQEVEHEYVSPPRRVRLHFFHVLSFTGEPCSLEGQQMRWVTPNEGINLPFLEADKSIVENLQLYTF